jgi:hypothetical protein
MPEFVVVLRTQSGATLKEGNDLQVIYQADAEPIKLLFRTRRKDRGFGLPTALDLTIEVSGKANSMDEAQREFRALAQGASNLLALGANAIVKQPPTVELAYDVTPEHDEHDFFQRRYAEPPLELLQGRFIHPFLLLPLYECFARHPKADRLNQAAAHYNVALSHWQPGAELLALNHLWIGVETLAPDFLERELRTRGISDEDLYKEWSLPAEKRRHNRRTKLEAAVRSRIIFEGDQECYRTAKDASDGFEHGFRSLKEVHDLAAKARDKTAAYLRRAIFDLAGLDEPARSALLDPPFNRPLERWRLDFQFRGKLVGAVDRLAPTGGEHPHFEWNEGNISATKLESGEINVTFSDESLRGRFGNGVTCEAKDLSVYGPRPDGKPLI